jgi:hypothetical protein
MLIYCSSNKVTKDKIDGCYSIHQLTNGNCEIKIIPNEKFPDFKCIDDDEFKLVLNEIKSLLEYVEYKQCWLEKFVIDLDMFDEFRFDEILAFICNLRHCLRMEIKCSGNLNLAKKYNAALNLSQMPKSLIVDDSLVHLIYITNGDLKILIGGGGTSVSLENKSNKFIIEYSKYGNEKFHVYANKYPENWLNALLFKIKSSVNVEDMKSVISSICLFDDLIDVSYLNHKSMTAENIDALEKLVNSNCKNEILFSAGYKYGHVRIKISKAQRDKMMKIVKSLNKSSEELDALMEREFPEVISMCGNIPGYVELNSGTINYVEIIIYILFIICLAALSLVSYLLIFHCNSED